MVIIIILNINNGSNFKCKLFEFKLVFLVDIFIGKFQFGYNSGEMGLSQFSNLKIFPS